MSDDQFRALCNTYGFAPSRSLRELLDTATAQARIAEREACAKAVEMLASMVIEKTAAHDFLIASAAAIRARGQE